MALPLVAATSIVTVATNAPQNPYERYAVSAPHEPEAIVNRSSPDPRAVSSVCRPIAKTIIEMRPTIPPTSSIRFPLPIAMLPTIAKMPADATRGRVAQQNQRSKETTCVDGLTIVLAEVENRYNGKSITVELPRPMIGILALKFHHGMLRLARARIAPRIPR